MTPIEAYHDKIPYAAWKWTLSRIVVEPVTEDVAEAAISLLRNTGLTATGTPSTRPSR
jgi:hypothetical protein